VGLRHDGSRYERRRTPVSFQSNDCSGESPSFIEAPILTGGNYLAGDRRREFTEVLRGVDARNAFSAVFS